MEFPHLNIFRILPPQVGKWSKLFADFKHQYESLMAMTEMTFVFKKSSKFERTYPLLECIIQLWTIISYGASYVVRWWILHHDFRPSEEIGCPKTSQMWSPLHSKTIRKGQIHVGTKDDNLSNIRIRSTKLLSN